MLMLVVAVKAETALERWGLMEARRRTVSAVLRC